MLSCTDFLMACDTALLFAMTIHLFYFPHSYHELLVAKYGCKREKSQEAKQRSAEEQRTHTRDGEGIRCGFVLGSSRSIG